MAKSPTTENQYDFKEVLDTVWDDLLDYMEPVPVLTELRKKQIPFRRSKLRDLQETTSSCTTTTEKSTAILQLVKDTGRDAYDSLKNCLSASGQVGLVHLMEAAEREADLTGLRERIKTELGQLSVEEKLCKELKEDLIAYYRERESTMPVAPLAEQHKAALTNFYVRPPMTVYTKPYAFGQESEIQNDFSVPKQQDKGRQKTPVKTLKELFFENNKPFKKIYVTADAGMGKTSFSRMLTVTWCQAHIPDPHIADKFDNDDLKTMKHFDFLFLIHLRDFSDMCFLDDMILRMLTSYLPKASNYSKEYVEQMLDNEVCLVIADGLDEWIHPKKCQGPPSEVVPHNKGWRGCSVLTTTRPWKLSNAGLSESSIKRHVEISELDEATSEKLASNVIEFLNENRKMDDTPSEIRPKRREDFEQTKSIQQLGFIHCIPYILLQMICLWFEGKQIGNSLCEVYSTIIESTLTRWLVNTDAGHKATPCDCKPKETVLNCMKNNTHCRREMTLILKIAKLAFFSLFNKVKEITLLFDMDFVLQYLNKSDLTKCLAIGLLSQVKDSRTLSSVRFIYFFPHKSIQEFFAGVHITLNWDEHVRQTISSVCKSVSNILEVSGVFVSVSGMNPDVYSCLSRDMSNIVATDPAIVAWRRNVIAERWYTEYIAVKEYQSMQVKCLVESERNGHERCQIVLEDVIISDTDNSDILQTVLVVNASSIKSLSVDLLTKQHTMQCEPPSMFPCLKKLHFSSHQRPSFISSILTASTSTLGYLRLEYTDLTSNDVKALSSLDYLVGLYLKQTSVSCDDLEHILTYINTNKSLSQLCLRYVRCSSSKQHNAETVHVLQLTEHKQLECLQLGIVNIDNLYINTESLTTCNLFLCLPHTTITNIFDSFMTGTMIIDLSLTLTCADDGNYCTGFTANLSQCTKIKKISLDLPPTELLINAGHLMECKIFAGRLQKDNLCSLLRQLHDAPMLKIFTILDVRDPPDRIVIPALHQLENFQVWSSELADNFITLSPGLNNLLRIRLFKVKMSISAWSELFHSTSRLPQAVTVMLEYINMTMEQWRKLLFDIIGKLPNPVNVTLVSLSGPIKDWERIMGDMQASVDFVVKSFRTDSNVTNIEFETVKRKETLK